jgi:hypothetical protein
MLRLIYISLLCCLLLTLTGCEKNSNVQMSSNPQAIASPQPNGAATTTTTTATATTTTAATGEQPQPASGENPAQAKPGFDACALLTKAEIESVQGEAVKETKNDGRNDGGLSISQCFYSVANFSKSVSLAVTQQDPDNPAKLAPREFWKRTFHRDDEQDREREKEQERERAREKKGEKKDEKERAQSGGREEEGEESAPPKKITGVGEEAYWTGSRVGGALYVLKKNAFIRISVGGPGKEDERINKSKALAQKALKRL